MTPWTRALLLGAVGAAVASGGLTTWLAAEPESKLIVAAEEIPEGTSITLGMLEAREVPTRFFSKRKLGATEVAGVMGQATPHLIRAGDFIDPTHFASRPEVCELEARALAPRFSVEAAELEDFVSRLVVPVR